MLKSDLQAIEPYRDHPAYELARTVLVHKALKYAVVEDRKEAWQLLRSIPWRHWNKTSFKRPQATGLAIADDKVPIMKFLQKLKERKGAKAPQAPGETRKGAGKNPSALSEIPGRGGHLWHSRGD